MGDRVMMAMTDLELVDTGLFIIFGVCEVHDGGGGAGLIGDKGSRWWTA
jgi:hypothetical protein